MNINFLSTLNWIILAPVLLIILALVLLYFFQYSMPAGRLQSDLEKIINEDPNPLTDPNMANALKDYYKTNSNYKAELHWMVERGIIDENDFNRIMAQNDADNDAGIEGPQFDQGYDITSSIKSD